MVYDVREWVVYGIREGMVYSIRERVSLRYTEGEMVYSIRVGGRHTTCKKGDDLTKSAFKNHDPPPPPPVFVMPESIIPFLRRKKLVNRISYNVECIASGDFPREVEGATGLGLGSLQIPEYTYSCSVFCVYGWCVLWFAITMYGMSVGPHHERTKREEKRIKMQECE